MFMVHEAFMDVFIEVLKTQYRGPKYRKIRVNWWNLGFVGRPFLCHEPQTIKIMNDDWNKWRMFDPNKPETHPGRQK